MTIKKNNVLVILSSEDFEILGQAYNIVNQITDEGDKACKANVEIKVVDEQGDEVDYDDIHSAYWDLKGILRLG